MSSSVTAFQQHLPKLDIPGPVQQYAIAAIFDGACQTGPRPSPPAEAALLQCLCLRSGQAVSVAVDKLIDAVRSKKLAESISQSLLLAALAVASASAVSPLAAGAVALWKDSLNHHHQQEEEHVHHDHHHHRSPPMVWKSHYLSKVLLACPGAGPELSAGICKLLRQTASEEEINPIKREACIDFDVLLSALRPFLCFVLLEDCHSTSPSSSSSSLVQQQQHLAVSLHSNLVRCAAALWQNPAAQHSLLCMLCSFLPALRVRTPGQQMAAEAFVADVLDALEACEKEPDAETVVCPLIASLFSLCVDVSRYGGNPSPFISAVAAISIYWPSLLLQSASPDDDDNDNGDGPLLQLASLSTTTATPSGSVQALSLLVSLLKKNAERNERRGFFPAATAACLSIQLVPQLAFGQIRSTREWTSRALSQLSQLHSLSYQKSIRIPSTSTTTHNNNNLLNEVWATPSTALRWLLSLKRDLSCSSSSSSSSSSASSKYGTLCSTTTTILLSLVRHDDEAVACVALDTLIAAVHAAPLLGLTALPILIHKLHTLVIDNKDSLNHLPTKNKGNTSSHVLLRTLYTLPLMAVHSAAVPFVIRALQPLLAPPAPELLQAVALRMLCEMWTTTGRGFPQLRTALLSYAAPAGGRPNFMASSLLDPLTKQKRLKGDAALRRAWAQTLVDVCAYDGARAAEFILSITDCIATTDDGGAAPAEIQAAGLECICELCESDVLDFYKAWKIVQPLVPSLPQYSRAAVQWLRLLGAGSLDVAVHPQVALGILGALWKATQHGVRSVRAQACASLAVYDFSTLTDALTTTISTSGDDQTQLPWEMWEIAALLQEENEPGNVPEYEVLVLHVLEYEYTNRRSSNSSRQQQQQQQQQVAGASGRAMNVGHGHRHRRRLLFKSNAGDGSSSSKKNSKKAADTAAAALTQKLVFALPKALLGSSSGSSRQGVFEFLRRVPDISPAAVLLLWAPPAPPPSTSSSASSRATAAAAKHAAEAYASVFVEVCKSAAGEVSLTAGGGGAPIDVEIWIPFLKRWFSASRDASTTGTVSERTEIGTKSIWSIIKSALENTHTLALSSNAATAAAALLLAQTTQQQQQQQPVKSVVEEVHAVLSQHAAQHDDSQVPVAIQSSACIALGQCIDAVRAVLGISAASTTLSLLQRHVECTQSTAVVVVVCSSSVTGLGHACRHLCRKSSSAQSGSPAVVELLKSSVCTLLGAVLSVLPPPLRHQLKENVISVFGDESSSSLFSPLDGRSSGSSSGSNTNEEVIDAVLGALAVAAPAMVALGLVKATATLRLAAIDMLTATTTSSTQRLIYYSGVCELLQATTLLGFKLNVVSAAEVTTTLALLKALINNSSGGGGSLPHLQNGKLIGTAAAALGKLVPGLVKEGFLFEDDADGDKNKNLSAPAACLQTLVTAASLAAAPGMTSTAAVKCGVAAGISSMLCARIEGHEQSAALTKVEKQALDTLESLALQVEDSQSSDSRSRRLCARSLAALCWAARQSSKSSSQSSPSSSTSGTDSRMPIELKGITALSENGALRYLCEAAATGTWPAISLDQSPSDDGGGGGESPLKTPPLPEQKEAAVVHVALTAGQSAAALRCLAAVPRLPAMDWSAACRRFLRAHPSSVAVKEACVALAAAHAAASPSLQLYDFVSDDVLLQCLHVVGENANTWQHHGQIAALEAVPQLLCAVPDAEAVSMLRMLCDACPTTTGGGGSVKRRDDDDDECSEREGRECSEWQAALLQSLALIAEQKEPRLADVVSTTAWECAVHIVLPKLAIPNTWPLSLTLPPLSSSFSASSFSQKTVRDDDAAERSWWALLRCLFASPPDFLPTQCQNSDNFKKLPLHWAWIACAAVANGALDLRALQQPRNLLLTGGNGSIDNAVVMWISRAFASFTAATTTTTVQQQWLIELLAAAEKCAAPGAALTLAVCGTVALACSVRIAGFTECEQRESGGVQDDGKKVILFGRQHAALVNIDSAVRELPESLRKLAEGVHPCPVALLAAVVKAIVLLPERVVAGAGGAGGGGGKELQRRCCMELRHDLPVHVWAELCRETGAV